MDYKKISYTIKWSQVYTEWILDRADNIEIDYGNMEEAAAVINKIMKM